MDEEQARARSLDAERLLSDPLLKETISDVEQALIRAVKNSKTPEEAFKSAIAMQVFDLLIGSIKMHAETGKIMEFNKRKKFGLF